MESASVKTPLSGVGLFAGFQGVFGSEDPDVVGKLLVGLWYRRTSLSKPI